MAFGARSNVCGCLCVCDCMSGFGYKTRLTLYTPFFFWKCHKTWFIVCRVSALFGFDNLNHSQFPYNPPPFFFSPQADMDYWNIKISSRRVPRSSIKMSGLYLQPGAAQQGQGLQLFVYVEPGTTWKVMSPCSCLFLNTGLELKQGFNINCSRNSYDMWRRRVG